MEFLGGEMFFNYFLMMIIFWDRVSVALAGLELPL